MSFDGEYDYDYLPNDTYHDYNFNSTYVESHSPFAIFQICVLTIISVFSFLSHVTILILIFKTSSLHAISYFYIANTSIASVLEVIFLPLNIMAFANWSYPFGSVMCKLMSCLNQIPYFMRNVFLMLLCIDCYTALQNHTEAYRRKMFRILTGVSWTIAVLLCIPIFYLTRISEVDEYCLESPLFSSDTFVSLSGITVFFIIPFALIFVYVSLMYPPKSVDDKLDKAFFNHRQFVKVLCIAFACCQLPYHVRTIISYFYPINTLVFHSDLFYLLMPLLFLDAAINAILIIWYTPEIKSKVAFWQKSSVLNTEEEENARL